MHSFSKEVRGNITSIPNDAVQLLALPLLIRFWVKISAWKLAVLCYFVVFVSPYR
jgi:hypothetical protein